MDHIHFVKAKAAIVKALFHSKNDRQLAAYFDEEVHHLWLRLLRGVKYKWE
jgi:hypothetical protein